MKRMMMKAMGMALALAILCTGGCFAAGEADGDRIDSLVSMMTTEAKIAQMIMPAIRTWNGEKVTDLESCPGLAAALRKHPYGGVILFGANIVDAAQTVRLTSALQANNAEAGGMPYFISADQEGGSVARLTMGTRGTGSMAIGATGDAASEHALAIGKVFGEELSALGINVNLGPCIDVIADLTDLGMSTRVFSDDPQMVSELGLAFAEGVGNSDVVTCYKHFPGAGDGSDYPTSIPLTLEQLEQTGLLTYRAAIEGGAEMVMISATTFPKFDDEALMADGVTKGYYPATISPKIVTGMLRETLGFDGVVMTDALEMQQFVTEPDTGAALFTGDYGTVEHDLQVAEKTINAGCDILLLPTDLNGQAAEQYYDDYIAGIAQMVEEGAISESLIDASVRRILTLKARRGLLDMDMQADVEAKVAAAVEIVGSAEHHAVEQNTARQAVTLLKNDGVLPLDGNGKTVVIIGRTALDNGPITYALDQLMQGGMIGANIRIENHISGENLGDEGSDTAIVIDRYYDTSGGGKLVYSDELSAAIERADAVICLSAVGAGIDKLQDDSLIMQGVSRALAEARQAGAKFILLSDNLPVDTARFQDADAIVCAYLSAGFGIDPTARTSGSENVGAFNANVPAALCAIFGAADMPGHLPIDIPVLEQDADGNWAYGDDILYERGFSAAASDYALDRVVVLSRHNIRSPLSGSGSLLGDITPHEWFKWTSKPSELSLRGAILETMMGQYFRLWLEDEGLFPENYRPEDGAVRFYANSKQRTLATANYFSAGLLPVVNIDIESHVDYDTMDPTFEPSLNFVTEQYAEDVRAQVAEMGGVAGMKGIQAGLRDAIELLIDVADIPESAAGNLLEDETTLRFELGKEPSMSGPIETATIVADALTLQYYEEADPVAAAFGHELSREDWLKLHSIVDTYTDMLFNCPLVCVNVAHPLLEEIRDELTVENRKFTFLCGHDCNLSSVLASLGVVDYSLPEAIEPKTPIGSKLVFERWLNGKGEAYYRVSMVYQSVDQFRDCARLSLDEPPMKVDMRFDGAVVNADGLLAESDLLSRLDAAIEAYDSLLSQYGMAQAAA